MAEALTKKQQKALAFKNKQKSKRRGDGELEQPDVPEQDLLNDDDEEVPEKAVEKKEKAKKEVAKDVEEGGAEESEKKKGKRKKTAWDDDEEEEEGEKVAKKSKKDIKQRFILFVGNLGFKTTKDRVEAVFRQALGETPSVRLLTNKPKPGSTMRPTSRGIAFVEFTNANLLQQALKLHHTDLDGRRINVELTVGGGGSGSARKEKLDEKKGRMTEQRGRKAEKEAEEGGEATQAQGEGEVKLRGGRRVKPKTDGQSLDRPPRGEGYSRGGGGDRGRGGFRGGARGGGDRGGRGSGRGGAGGRGGYSSGPRKKWEPTGANAVSVG